MTLADSFNPYKAKGIKECGKVSFNQQDFPCENVMEIEQGEEEKGENHIKRLNFLAPERHH